MRVLVCDFDELVASAVARLVAERDDELVASCRNGIEALRLTEVELPEVVVMRHQLQGTSGLELTGDLRRLDPAPEVILLGDTSERALVDGAAAAGAFAVVELGDVAALEEVLDRLGNQVETGERRSGDDRRSGQDRRQVQDWSKVFSERRSGEERRKGARRTDDR